MTNPNPRLMALNDQVVDVVIIGGGVNGAGLFRDLCEQGVTCAIVDKGDFGSGTSAAPSRMIHGGLKYLETGEFGLVAQSTLERNLLLKNAPHVVAPLATVIPIFSWTKGIMAALRTLFGSKTAPRSRGALLIKMGMFLYDFYGSRHRVMPRHKMMGRARALREFPSMTPTIVAAAQYYDARVEQPERLVLELVQDGLAANKASAAANYCNLQGVVDGALALRLADGAAVTLRPKLVINAAGPWIDHVNATLGEKTALIGGTKGSHILMDHPNLLAMLRGRMIYFEGNDGRILLVYEYLGRVLVGATDIPADNPDDVKIDDAEIDYFLNALRGLLPRMVFDRGQIVYAYSGIRPLPNSKGTAPGLISRDHSAPVTVANAARPFDIISLVGGKWTTFRGFAAEVADTVLARLSRARQVSTETLPIGGGRGYPADRGAWVQDAAARFGVTAGRAHDLLARYGTTATAILEHVGAYKDADRLPDAGDVSLAELDWLVRNEMVVHLADLAQRRCTLAVTGRLTARDLAVMADVAAAALGWDAATKQAEIAATTERLTAVNRMVL